jgi:hypothetical protein
MGDHQVVTWYLDYQHHDGLMVPFIIERESTQTFHPQSCHHGIATVS